MKRLLLLLLMTTVFTLTSCSFKYDYYRNQADPSLVTETWMKQVNTNPNAWIRKADTWYFTGDPNATERYANHAPYATAMTISAVRVPQFTQVIARGSFEVQIIGRQDKNSVYILGPNAAARQVSVQIRNNTLFVSQTTPSDNLRNVIVRIGVRDLKKLTNLGPGLIIGRDITSSGLFVTSCSTGNILLGGRILLCGVKQIGRSTVTIMGAYSPKVVVYVRGSGNVNITGCVGIQCIVHLGDGCVNILGASSTSLSIDARGGGFTSVVGYVNLKRVTAEQSSRVYVYWVNSNGIYICAKDKARIGIAGATLNLSVDATGASRFEGQNLRSNTAYVRTRNFAHANVLAVKKLFASGDDQSSIYFFGSPELVSRFMNGEATVVPVWSPAPPVVRPLVKKEYFK